MSFIGFAPTSLALWVAAWSVWAIWRQVPPILEYGLWDVSNSTRTVTIAAVLLGLAMAYLRGAKDERPYAVKAFGVMAVMVATPLVFVGVRDNLPVMGYSYYAGFDWIASERVQLAWLVLTVLSVFALTHRSVVHERHRADTSAQARTAFDVWATTLYWVVTAWFTVLALNAISPFWSQTWIDFFAKISSGDPNQLYISPRNVMVLGIALALWLRSGAALWLICVWILSSYWRRFTEFDGYVPIDLDDVRREYWLYHPAVLVAILGSVLLVRRAGILRAF